ncbi:MULTISPECIES: DUF2793 domain-containing protein [Sphingomonas]|jgi:hypothetical protein|uniref:DUF2793 domain-containing protein n=1 Tax=Sphingomonas hankookensis TaxID=563996 RepID=A0ABR5YDF0_9SPHN|nr:MULTISPECIES: DUF2793 domain-containing protein [Sphingomonas]KZE14686.1 hypothetical protein AVT10_14645 [Sphingomonas hankookensis]PZT92110.1 MAG: DUF2793 domain-containing protein [Sphingomonas sp.]RSV23829.1 DUF2793 domain-containing protein [Sphingomonas sp. ABOLH]WCP72672.1 DUF2793 domain-containing protein [Sphingomonas hankookensis]
MNELTHRLGLPLLHVAQAHKEMAHNEALMLVDLLLHGCVAGVAQDAPPVAAAPGQCWITGAAPSGEWAGQAGRIAGMTEGGWRFVSPREGMRFWWTGGETTVEFRGGAWRLGEVSARRIVIAGNPVVGAQQPAIAAPQGGTARDEEARTAVTAILAALRAHGLIAG